MQDIVRFLTEMRDVITDVGTTPQTADHYYFAGQLYLIDRLIRLIGEGALSDGTRSVQGGIELLSPEES